MSNNVVVYRHPDEFPEDVVELFALAECDSVAFGSRWFRNFIATVSQPTDVVRFHVLRRDSRAVAALPVFVKRGRVPFHNAVESLGNYYTALYAPAIGPDLNASDLAALIQAVRREHAPISALRLQPMDPQSRAYRMLLPALRMAGLVPFEFLCFGNWFLRNPVDWRSYLATRNSKTRSNIKRMEKKLTEDGGSVEIIGDAAHRERAIATYERVYAASWKQQEPYPHFMPGLITQAAQAGWLRLGIASLHGQPIAAQVWIVANGKADIYKVAYDDAFKEYSPGTVLTAQLMQHVIEKDCVNEVDYLIGDDPYKKTWMNDRRERWGIIAYNPVTIPGAVGAAREALGRVVKRVVQRLRVKRTGDGRA